MTNDEELAQAMKMWRDHGSQRRYHHEFLGTNARIDEIQSAILRVKLRYLDQWNQARQAHARVYTEQLGGFVQKVPRPQPWATSAYYVYVVEVEERDSFRRALEAEGVATGVHYPIPLHLQPACADYGYQPGNFPVTEQAAKHIVSLPMYPELTPEQLEQVIAAVKKSLLADFVR